MGERNSAGLQELGNGAYAWLAPRGTWGWSNAGLIADSGDSLLVDTLYDLDLTGEMLRKMRDAEPCTQRIGTLVNTHANGDHCHGNELVAGAEIIASTASAEEMAALPPEAMAAFVAAASEMGRVGQYFLHCFGQFKFEGIRYTPPTRTFDGELDLGVGDKPIHLIEVGPAHTRGDVLVHSPVDRVVFTGDILFIEGTPVIWEGPVANWIKACRLIEAMDVEQIVPGPAHWVAWLGRAAPMVWVTVESFRYWSILRRRLRLGLADAVVANRFLLWGIWSAATFVNLAADPVARVAYVALAGSSTEIVMDVLWPVGLGTMGVAMVLGIVSAATLLLTFFPTAAYRRWVEARAEARAV